MPRWQVEARAAMRYRQHRAIQNVTIMTVIGFAFGAAIGHFSLMASAVTLGACVLIVAVQSAFAARFRKQAYALDRETNESIRVVDDEPLKEPSS